MGIIEIKHRINFYNFSLFNIILLNAMISKRDDALCERYGKNSWCSIFTLSEIIYYTGTSCFGYWVRSGGYREIKYPID